MSAGGWATVRARALDVPVVICGRADVLADFCSAVTHLLTDLVTDSTGEPAAGTVTIRLARPVAGDGTADAVGQGLTELTAAVVNGSGLFCAHAAVLARADRGLICLPADSGAGKTTVTAALVAAGWTYLSDEVLAVDRQDGAILPFARPLALDRRSWDLLRLDPAGAPVGDGQEALLAPSALGVVAAASARHRGIAHVVVPNRQPPGTPPTLDPLPRSVAVAQLLRCSFNHYVDPAGSFDTVVTAARSARAWSLTYGDARTVPGVLLSNLPPR